MALDEGWTQLPTARFHWTDEIAAFGLARPVGRVDALPVEQGTARLQSETHAGSKPDASDLQDTPTSELRGRDRFVAGSSTNAEVDPARSRCRPRSSDWMCAYGGPIGLTRRPPQSLAVPGGRAANARMTRRP